MDGWNEERRKAYFCTIELFLDEMMKQISDVDI